MAIGRCIDYLPRLAGRLQISPSLIVSCSRHRRSPKLAVGMIQW